MEKVYKQNEPLFVKIDHRAWGIPLSSSSNESSGDESPLFESHSLSTHDDTSMSAINTTSSTYLDRPQVLDLHELVDTKSSCQISTDTVPKTDCFTNRNLKRISHAKQADLESAMYHQHLIPSNESIACIQPKNITLYFSSDNERTADSMSSTSMTTPTITQEDLDQLQSDYQALDQKAGLDHRILQDTCTSSNGNGSGFKSLPLKKSYGKKLALFAKRKHLPEVVSTDASLPVETPTRKKNKKTATGQNAESSRPIIKNKQKRTVTSYDSQTSLYLKSVFFEVYSCQNKLTKQQRVQVQKRTGLPSRNITYWFSNHKRRFHQNLAVYRKTVEDSNGSIKNYSDFLEWRRARGLPDQISQVEVKRLAEESRKQANSSIKEEN